MSCACGCGSCGLGRNLDLSILGRTRRGLRGLGNVPGGSQIRVGFKYSPRIFRDSSLDPRTVKQTVEGCLYGTGAFNSVTAEYTKGTLSEYVTIRATTGTDFGSPEDIANLIENRIRECYPDLGVQIDRRDQILVDAVPQGTNISTIPVESRPPAPNQSQPGSDSLLSLVGLGGASNSGTSNSTSLIIPILLAVVIAKAFK